MVSDHFIDKQKENKPWVNPYIFPTDKWIPYNPPATKEDIEDLREEIEDLKDLLKRAIKYDADNNQPKCEDAVKKEVLIKLGELVGIDLKEILK
jgi:hypothetical protein